MYSRDRVEGPTLACLSGLEDMTTHLLPFPPTDCGTCQLISSYLRVTSELPCPHSLLQIDLDVLSVKIPNWHSEQDGICLVLRDSLFVPSLCS